MSVLIRPDLCRQEENRVLPLVAIDVEVSPRAANVSESVVRRISLFVVHLSPETCGIVAAAIPTLIVAVAVERAIVGRVVLGNLERGKRVQDFHRAAMWLGAFAFGVSINGVETAGLGWFGSIFVLVAIGLLFYYIYTLMNVSFSVQLHDQARLYKRYVRWKRDRDANDNEDAGEG